MKIFFTLLFYTCFTFALHAQYCGHFGNPSGSNQCVATGLPYKGIEKPDSIAPFINGEESTTVIQFQNFDTISFGGQTLTIQWLRIDSLGNLPQGLCWTTNKPDNKFTTGEAGCIKISGTTCDLPGQYRLKIIVTPYVGAPIIYDPDDGLRYFVRAKNTNDATIPIDTTQTRANQFISYGNAIAGCTPSGISSMDVLQNTLEIMPNPFTYKTTVQFSANSIGSYTQTITNLIGSEVYRTAVDVIQGENRFNINAENLPAGIYFYSISNGINRVTKRIVIE